MTPSPAQINKSTTGRTLRVPRWLRSGMQVAYRLAPPLGGSLARRLYFRPSRLRASSAEVAVLARGTPVELQVGDDRVVARTWGRGGPAVLLVHGWSGQMSQLTPLVDPLLEQGFRVVAFDWPGHGASTGSLSSLAHALRVFPQLEQLTGGFEAVFAHSLGAVATSLGLSRGVLSAKRAVFFAPASRLAPWFHQFATAFEFDEGQEAGFISATESWLGESLANFEPLTTPPTVPMLVLHSRDDRDVPFADAEALVAACPAATLVPLDGLGHRRLLRDAPTVARAVTFATGAVP
jgi:alpha-beta hydrolase superfamily lysophospholipase